MRGTVVELEDITEVAVEGTAAGVAPHEDLGADAHLRGGKAHAGCRVHGLDHVGDEIRQGRVERFHGCGLSV